MKTKIYKVLSIMLTLAVILSTCLCAIGTVSAEDATYYVSATGDDAAAGTKGAPKATLKAAVDAAIAAGYDADDTVYVKTIGADSIGTGLAARERLAAYAFKLVVTAADATVPGVIGANGAVLQVGGETEFTFVTVKGEVAFDGNNITFGDGASLSSNGATYVAQNTNAYSFTSKAPVNIKISTYANAGLYLNGAYYNYATYNHPVTVEIDNFSPFYRDAVYGGFFLSTGNCTGTYNSLVNFKIDNSTIVLPFKSTTAKAVYGENFALQVINSSGKVIAKTGDTLTRSDSATGIHTSALDSIDAGKKYILTNTSGLKDILAFTDTAGKFAVTDSRYVVTATPTTGDPIVSKDGFLTVPAGEYTISASKVPETVTYYVSATGDDTATGTESAPLCSVDAAIEKAVAAGYMKGDTVYVKGIGTDPVFWKTTTGGTLASHSFLLDISSASTESITTFGAVNDTITTTMIHLGGPTKFSNMKIANKSSNNYIGFGFYGNDVTFGEGVSYASYYINYQAGTWNTGAYPNSGTYNKPINLEFNSHIRYLNLGNNYGGATFNDDINITVNAPTAEPTFYFSCSNAKATYNGNINLNFKQATGITLTKNGGGSHAFGEDANIQIINSTAADVTSATGELANITAPKYIINNTTGKPNIIDFTDTVGKFKVDLTATRFEIRATDAEGNIIKADENGYITLPEAGDYTLSLYKDPETATYYISGSGSDDAEGTKNAPLKTVVGAINKASANDIIAGDTLNVIVLDETTWFAADENNTPVHAFQLNVTTIDAQTIVPIKANPGMGFGGNTYIDNLNFSNFGQYNTVRFNDYDVTIGSGATFKPYNIALGSANTGNTVPGQTVVFNNALTLSDCVRLANNNNGTKTYSEDVNIIINNRSASPTFVMSMTYGHKSTYEKNINLNVKDASSVGFKYSAFAGYNPTVEVKGAIQFIVDKDYTTIPDATKEYLDSVAPANGVYYIRNNSGIDGLLSFTDYAGDFAVDTETYIVKATDKNGNETIAADGSLYLENPGEYVITAKPRPATTLEYFVELGSTAENTYPTVAAAIDAAKLAGLTKIDYLVVKVKGNATIGAIAEYPFTLIVESAEETATLNVQNYMLARGRTIYRNINLDAETLYLNGGAVTLEKDVSFNGLCIAIENAKAIINAKLALVDIIGEGNLDITVNNPESEFTVNFGTASFTDVRLNVKSAAKVEFAGTPNVSGKVEIAVNKNTTVVGKAVIDAIAAQKWYIVNQTGDADALDFTDIIGTYTYVSGREVALTNGSNEYVPVNTVITAPVGEYNFVIKTQAEAKYADYIKNRGTGLKNSFAKLSNGEEVNVLYFGGSVTNGTGASSENATSWRGLIGSWLVNTFPAAKVNNINVAYGGTSTMFGSYRLKEEVLSQAPDLIFVEFSINDHYDNTSGSKLYPVTKELAAKRFETIVRQIREEYPECDIVTILTTEKAYINTNRNGNLHEQAQGHEDISIAYDIPSIHIGRALSDHLSPNYADNNYAEWYEYVTDIVHPNDKGYEVYYNVIKEYLADELIYSDYDGSKSAHTVPELQSDVLMDGDVKYVDATQALVTESGTLGGSGFEYTTSGGMRGNFAGGAKATAGNDSKFVIKFTGTELALLSNNCKAKEFTVTVDGGTPTTVKKTGIYPEVLATGLNYGEHTVEIVPVFDSDTTFTIIGFFTRNENVATHKHTYSNYVSNNDATCQKNETETASCDFGCGEQDTREIANSKTDHKFTSYVNNDDAECGKNATETATCDYGCGEEDTREIEGTALEHEFDGPTDTDCNNGCGYTRPLGKMLVEEGEEKYYYNNGVKQTEVTDLVWIDGVWYYIEEGRWASDIDTLHKINGKWFLVKGGIWNKTTGLEEYKGKTFYVVGGKWDASVTDLKKVDGVWYYIQYGKWNNTIDTLHKINGKWFLIKNGIWNKTTGLVEYKDKTFYVVGGKWNSSVNTLYKKGSKYYAIKSGKLYEGKTIITYSGKKFYCNKGYAQLSFSGKVKIGTKTYTIKAGKVV